jgi:hypothetical protein
MSIQQTQPLTSVVSYPDRGQGGNPRFWGNCSPRLIEDLFRHYRPRLVYDPAVGSGTSSDVAQRLGIPGFFSDLVRGHNVLQDEPPYSGFDLAFFHPPYHDMVTYTGPSSVWGGQALAGDLSRCSSYDEFIARLNQASYRIYETLRQGGRLAILVGDLRRRGKFYPIQRDVRWYGEPESLIIKAQHNMRSNRRSYSGNFVAIVHEYLVITRKPEAWVVPLRVTMIKRSDTSRWDGVTWQSIVRGALERIGGQADQSGTDWQAIVRRELQERPHFRRLHRGRWALAAEVRVMEVANV